MAQFTVVAEHDGEHSECIKMAEKVRSFRKELETMLWKISQQKVKFNKHIHTATTLLTFLKLPT